MSARERIAAWLRVQELPSAWEVAAAMTAGFGFGAWVVW